MLSPKGCVRVNGTRVLSSQGALAMLKWLKIIRFIEEKTGAQSVRAQPRITGSWVSTRAQVFSDIILTPLHIVPVKMLGNCPRRLVPKMAYLGWDRAREMATVLRN